MDQALNVTASRARYAAVSIVLHWLIAALVFGLIVLGWRMDNLGGPDQFAIFQLHKSFGISVLLLSLVRIGWRFAQRPPPALISSGWQYWLARIVHFLFYVLLLAMPLSGWLAVSTSKIQVPTVLFHLVAWPDFPATGGLDAATRDAANAASEELHSALAWLLYGLVFLHVAGALKHHFDDSRPSLARMIPGVRPRRLGDIRLIAVFAGILLLVGGLAIYRSRGVVAVAQPARSLPRSVAQAEKAAEPRESTINAAAVQNTTTSSEEDELVVPSWTIESNSTLAFTALWEGEQIDGQFRDWKANIRFHPDALDRSSVKVTVAVGSAVSGRSEVDDALPRETWFNAAAFPTATFEANRFERVGKDEYRATGRLTMKGLSRRLTFPFHLNMDGETATMNAHISLDRLAYGIGTGEFADTSSIPAAVGVDAKLNARRVAAR